MKRTRYDSEYDKVKRSNAPRPAQPAPQPERPKTPREVERANVQAMVDDLDARNREIEVAERDRARQASEESAHRSREFNERSIRNEYAVRGLKPPVGTLVSLSTLLFTGWTIGENEDQRAVLIPPAAAPPRKRREDYDQNT